MYVDVTLYPGLSMIFNACRKIGKTWSIWWCNDDVSATITAMVCRNIGRYIIITSLNQPGLPDFSACVENMGRPGYVAPPEMVSALYMYSMHTMFSLAGHLCAGFFPRWWGLGVVGLNHHSINLIVLPLNLFWPPLIVKCWKCYTKCTLIACNSLSFLEFEKYYSGQNPVCDMSSLH